MRYQVKRGYAAGVHFGAEEVGKYCADILGKEVAELLPQVIGNSLELLEDGMTKECLN